MDVARPRRRSLATPPVLAALAATALGGGAWYALPTLLHGAAALPTIAADAIVLDVVRRGTLVRAVHASGDLVPDRVHVVATSAEGIVTSIGVRAGSRVAAGTVIATLDNPDLDAAARDAAAQVTAALALARSAREEAAASRLDRAAAYRSALAESQRASEESRADTGLIAAGYISNLVYREATIKAGETHDLAGIAARKITVDAADEAAKVALAEAGAERAAATLAAARARVATLIVRAGSAGIVQSLSADAGARVAVGTEIARIAGEGDLKAVLQIAEGDMHGVVPGMGVALETSGSGDLAGHVARIAPVAVNGSVAVDVALDRVRAGIRPAQNVDGTIELFRRRNVLTLARPAGAADGTAIELFVLEPGTQRARRVRVRLGTGSLERVEVRSGLAPGDTVIVSDTSAYASASSIRIVASR